MQRIAEVDKNTKWYIAWHPWNEADAKRLGWTTAKKYVDYRNEEGIYLWFLEEDVPSSVLNLVEEIYQGLSRPTYPVC